MESVHIDYGSRMPDAYIQRSFCDILAIFKYPLYHTLDCKLWICQGPAARRDLGRPRSNERGHLRLRVQRAAAGGSTLYAVTEDLFPATRDDETSTIYQLPEEGFYVIFPDQNTQPREE